MREYKKLTKKLPEPFNTALQLNDFSFNYHLMPNKSDHAWLRNHGYTTRMGADCACYTERNDGKGVSLMATSWGDWGTAYCGGLWGDDEGFDLFCQMYSEDIIIPWRIRFYHNYNTFDYDHLKKEWRMCNHETHEWSDCENPLPKVLAEKNEEF